MLTGWKNIAQMLATKISANGRVVIPAEIRQALHLRDGDSVYWELVDGEARLSTRRTRLEKARAIFQAAAPKHRSRSMADELITQRRKEATSRAVNEGLDAKAHRRRQAPGHDVPRAALPGEEAGDRLKPMNCTRRLSAPGSSVSAVNPGREA